MNADFAITFLMLWSTFFALFPNLLRERRPNWKALDVSFASFFVAGLGAIIGSYLLGALSSLLGINGKDEKFALEFLGFITGLAVMRFYIVPKMVIPKFTQATRDQEEPPLSPLPPQDP